ncbi:MAG: hypothetical protein JO156_09065 [Solirubrobacterales bacterium]|nr:hypothetical protein [Solirubrobacterales bacterium]
MSGIGVHRLTCTAYNNARDASGARGASAPATWTLGVREPSVSTISFSRVVDALRCGRMTERVEVPAHWETGRWHGHPVRVRIPAQTRTVVVTHCHPRFVRRRVLVNGHWHVERVIVLPHTLHQGSRRVQFGGATTVSGWLGTAGGDAIGNQPVQILAAPDNGSNRFSLIAVTTTAADGSWTASVPSGPSRLLRALYGGSWDLEPSTSNPVHVVVPAAIRISVGPGFTHWGSAIEITGKVKGGFVPPAGEVIVLWIGWPGGSTEIGHVYTATNGSFRASYTFLRGTGTETYRLWAATARESDYPYAVGTSNQATVTVGP